MINIVIVDDQTLMRDGLQTILNLEEDMRVVGTASNGEEALQVIAEYRPNVVLMDIQMPGMNGIECTKQIKPLYPDTVVIILTTFTDEDYIVEGLSSGAVGFLPKDMPGDKLIQAIRDGVNGEFILPSSIAAKLVSKLTRISSTSLMQFDASRLKSEGVFFTEREKSIIKQMIEGRTNRQIASMLFMQEGTIKNYISGIYNKIGTNDRTAAILILKELLDA